MLYFCCIPVQVASRASIGITVWEAVQGGAITACVIVIRCERCNTHCLYSTQALMEATWYVPTDSVWDQRKIFDGAQKLIHARLAPVVTALEHKKCAQQLLYISLHLIWDIW